MEVEERRTGMILVCFAAEEEPVFITGK